MVTDGVAELPVLSQDTPSLAGAITGALRDHTHADTLSRAGHDVAHDHLCIDLMVTAV